MADNPPIGLPRLVFVDVIDLPQGRKPTTAEVKQALNALQSRLVKEAEQGAARAMRRAKAQIERQEAANQKAPKKGAPEPAAEAATQDEPEPSHDTDV